MQVRLQMATDGMVDAVQIEVVLTDEANAIGEAAQVGPLGYSVYAVLRSVFRTPRHHLLAFACTLKPIHE